MTQPGRIHEKAVDMIAEACRGAYAIPRHYDKRHPDPGILVRLQPGKDEWSADLMQGIAKVKITDPEWDAVGGIAPDLILYDTEEKPKRIVEVIVTSAPDEKKREKLQMLSRRGVDVVEVMVKTEEDLLALFPSIGKPRFAAKREVHGASAQAEEQLRHGQAAILDQLTTALIVADPAARRKFLHVLDEARALDSIYPTRPR